MRFTHKGTRITLHSLKADLSKCTAISANVQKGARRFLGGDPQPRA